MVVRITGNPLLFIIGLATLLATGVEVARLIEISTVTLSNLFLLFIYAEVIGVIGAFYRSHRIPVTLPIIIAMTALWRMITLRSKAEFIDKRRRRER